MTLTDKFGRQITEVRVSVTDRCNFRCVYCRSAKPEHHMPEGDLLDWGEYERLVRILVGMGIRKVRVTGGEPLVRPGVEDFIARLKAAGVPIFRSPRTAHLLAERCDALIAAGLDRINISLDSLDRAKFERITRTQSFDHVIAGIDAAQGSRAAAREGKCRPGARDQRRRNGSVRRIRARARPDHALHRIHAARCGPRVDARPGGHRGGNSSPHFRALAARPRRSPTQRNGPQIPLRRRQRGEIGLIAPVSQPFCGACSRIRLTADGKLRTCLFSRERS